MLIDEDVELLSSMTDTRLKAAPELKLLLELEPARRVFVRNLTDIIFRRPLPANPGTSKPGRYWTDVFVPTGLPWGSFMESLLLHLGVLSVIATVGQSWARQQQIQREIEAHNSFISYYAPSKTFPTNRSRPQERERPKREHNPVRQNPMRVAREHSKAEIKPPDVRMDRDRRLDSLASNSASAKPVFAPKLPQPTVPTGPTSVVAPAPEVSQVTARRGEMSPSAVAPPSEAAAVLSGRTVAAPNAMVVAPPPSLRSATGKAGANLGSVGVVAPSPSLSVREQRSNSGAALANLGPGTSVIPPPQSVKGAGGGRVTSGLVGLAVPPAPSMAGGSGRKGSLLSGNAQVVPPPQAMGSVSARNGRVSSGLVSLVVPPPPSVQGSGRPGPGQISSLPGSQIVPPPQSIVGSRGLSNGRGGAGLGSRVVPPPPSVANAGARGGSGTGPSLPGALKVVPPPESIKGAGTVAGGPTGSGLGSQAVPPSPTVAGTGGSGARQMSAALGTGAQPIPPPPPSGGGANGPPSGREVGSLTATDTNPAIPPPPAMENSSDPATIELPLRVIGLALALPTSSYFSNYEVFIAERRLKKGGSELIKLVSVSLPYQPRLSEYGVDNSKVYKLHVTRDPSCDESLLQMTWPEANGPPPESQYGTGSPAAAPGTGRDKLPCYRTTADEYWRALSGKR